MINHLEFSEREEVISMSFKKYMEFGMQTYQLKKELSCQ